ncbi:MAG: aminomethyl-transferring glycine dehydrogenase, partial [Actinomycetota bacterium]
MLDILGFNSMQQLLQAAIPAQIRIDEPLNLPPALTEREVLNELRTLANQNTKVTSLLGLGYYDTITPSVIQRNILENPAWYTSYTP